MRKKNVRGIRIVTKRLSDITGKSHGTHFREDQVTKISLSRNPIHILYTEIAENQIFYFFRGVFFNKLGKIQ